MEALDELRAIEGRGDSGNFLSALTSLGRRFTESECSEYQTTLEALIKKIRRGKVAEWFLSQLKESRAVLDGKSDQFKETVDTVLVGIERSFREESEEDKKSLFIMPRPASVPGQTDYEIDGKFSEPHDPARFVHRTLYPVWNESVQKCCDAVRQSEFVRKNIDGLVQTIQKFMETDPSTTARQKQTRVQADLKSRLTLLMNQMDIPDRFVSEFFNFGRVVEGQLAMWAELLSLARVNADNLKIFFASTTVVLRRIFSGLTGMDSTGKTSRT